MEEHLHERENPSSQSGGAVGGGGDEDERVIASVSLHIWPRMFPHEVDAD